MRLEQLAWQREVVVRRIEEDKGPHTAALSRELRAIDREIAEVEKLERKGSIVDDLAARRNRPGSEGESATAGSGP